MYKTKKQYSVIFKAPLKSEHIKIVVFEKKKKLYLEKHVSLSSLINGNRIILGPV